MDISTQEDVPSENQIKQIKELVKSTPDGVKTVLVVGCGDGTEIKEFRNAGYEVIGIQVNKGQNAKIREQGFMARNMDMHFMDFENEAFDLIYCKDCFKQAISPTIAFAEFCRVAKKYILISEPDMRWAWKAHNYQLFTTGQFEIMGLKFNYPLIRHWIIHTPYVEQNNYLFKR